jgi:hypothetical protein
MSEKHHEDRQPLFTWRIGPEKFLVIVAVLALTWLFNGDLTAERISGTITVIVVASAVVGVCVWIQRLRRR